MTTTTTKCKCNEPKIANSPPGEEREVSHFGMLQLYGENNRQIIQTDKQTKSQTNKKADKRTSRQTKIHAEKQINKPQSDQPASQTDRGGGQTSTSCTFCRTGARRRCSTASSSFASRANHAAASPAVGAACSSCASRPGEDSHSPHKLGQKRS